MDVRAGAGVEPLAGLEVGGVSHWPSSGTQKGWPSVAVTSAVASPLSPSVSMTTLTRCFRPSPLISAVTVSTRVSPKSLGQDSPVSELTMMKADGGTVVFKGTKNPAMSTGDALEVGPLPGTVASGDTLEAYGGTLKVTAFGFITITCTATGPQAPGPFVFD
ncbi:hypothetical protein [Streptomyces sp. Vc74B-19]|uniref:hypothetical protein n=1 Tax=Streptomyces sp. Vc74B-19 TaxID=2741324 RepID=UPI0035B43996